jgi:rhamnosyltransferase
MMSTSPRVIALVTVYDPGALLLDSIASYHDVTALTLLWQNSPVAESILTAVHDRFGTRCRFLGDGSNIGIGAALNALVQAARELEATHVLLMDQDSVFTPGAAQRLWHVAQAGTGTHLYAPIHRVSDTGVQPVSRPDPQWVMTSGSLLSLATFDRVGPFHEAYFIDGVDMEWCARLKACSGTITLVPDAVLHHQLGDASYHTILGIKTVLATHHPPYRYYYIFRNYTHLLFHKKRAGWSFNAAIVRIMIQLVLSVLFFETQTRIKLSYMLKGIRHCIRQEFGALLEN